MRKGVEVDKRSEFKLVLTGHEGFEITPTATRIIQQILLEAYDPTLESHHKQVMIDGETCLMEYFDTSGMQDTAEIDQWYKDGDGFVIIYSIRSRKSFEAARSHWEKIRKVKDQTNQSPICCLLGSKSDTVEEREVGEEEGRKLAEDLGCIFQEYSAQERESIQEPFNNLVRAIKMQVIDKEGLDVKTKKVLWKRVLCC